MAKGENKVELKGKTDEELAEFIRVTGKSVLDLRFQNFTNRLNDTSQLRKTRRELARAMTERSVRATAPQAESKKVEGL